MSISHARSHAAHQSHTQHPHETVLFGLPVEDVEFVGFDPNQKLKDWCWEKIRAMLKMADPQANFHASIVAVRGGYEVSLKMGIDFWELASKSVAPSVPLAFKSAYKRLRERYYMLKTQEYTADQLDRLGNH